jgi:AcrR family transcriptional regulator
MRTHGWGGHTPADDDEAIERILEATRVCIDREGANASIADVARTLGVTRQTVYRYFPSTEDLQRAVAMSATAPFLDRVDDHLAGNIGAPADIVVEGLAFSIERLPHEPYLGLLLSTARVGAFTEGMTSPAALALGRLIVERFPVDWAMHGFDSADLDGLAEHLLRMTQSFLLDLGTPVRDGAALREYFDVWVGPAITAKVSSSR